ncbi:MAG: hypothetical protein EA424_05000, partial [Planctomycetaceae bacterium]
MSQRNCYAKFVSLPLCHGLIAGLVMLGFTGCGSSPSPESPAIVADDHDHDHDHDHHDHEQVENFAEGVSTLRGHYETIRDALDEDDIDTAHDPIHQVGHLLEGLKQLVDHVGLDADDKATAHAAIDAMFAAYGEVDKAIHGAQPVDYDSVREPLDQGMADL